MSMPIAEGITAAKLALDASRAALDLLRHPKVDGEQVRTKLIELQDLVHSAQQALGEADDENRMLKRQLADKHALEALRADMDYQQDGGFYIRKSERDAGNPVIYCPACWGENDRLIPLKPSGDKGAYDCVIHKVRYNTDARLKAIQDSVDRYNRGASRRHVTDI
jgi:hypothetical protein